MTRNFFTSRFAQVVSATCVIAILLPGVTLPPGNAAVASTAAGETARTLAAIDQPGGSTAATRQDSDNRKPPPGAAAGYKQFMKALGSGAIDGVTSRGKILTASPVLAVVPTVTVAPRQAGRGQVAVSLPRAVRQGRVSHLKVTLKTGQPLRFTDAGGSRWKCQIHRSQRSTVCAHQKRIKVGTAAQRINATVAARAKNVAQSRLKVKATWRVHTPQADGVRQSARAAAPVSIDPRLRLRILRPPRDVAATRSAKSRQVHVPLHVAGLGSRPGRINWTARPVGSPTPGKKIRWVTPKSATVTDGKQTTVFRVPQLKGKKPRTYLISARLRSGPTVEKRQFKLRVQGVGPRKLRPRLGRIKNILPSRHVATNSIRSALWLPIPGEFGPKELKLSALKLGIAATGDALLCQPQTRNAQGSSSEDVLAAASYALRANVQVLGVDVRIAGQVDKNGYCLVGQLPTLQMGDPGPTLSNGIIVYSSYAATVEVTDSTTLDVAARQLRLHGETTIPQLSELSSQLSAELVVDGQITPMAAGWSGDLSASLAVPEVEVGRTASTRLHIGGRGRLWVSFATGSHARAGVSVDGRITTVASEDGSVAASTTPVAASLGVDFSRGSLALAAGVSNGGESTDDAFGVEGLTVRDLAVSGTVGASSSIALVADVNVPHRWVSDIGIQPDTPVAVAIQLGNAANSCLTMALGDYDESRLALDIANAGILTATYAKIAIAPLGCGIQMPDGTTTTVEPGYQMVFNGSIGASPVTVSSSFSPPSSAAPGLQVQSQVSLGSWDLAGVTFKKSSLALDIDTATSDIGIGFAGGIRFGKQDIAFDLGFNAQSGTFTASGTASADLDYGAVDLDGSLEFAVEVNTRTGTVTTAALTWNGKASILGKGLSFSGSAASDQGRVTSVVMATSAKLSVLGVADVNGTVTVTYRDASSRYVKAHFKGSYKLAWWSQTVDTDLFSVTF